MSSVHDEFNAAIAARGARERGDGERIAELMNLHPLEMWFGLPPSELQLVLESGSAALAESSPVGHAVLQLLSADRLGLAGAAEATEDDRISPFVDALKKRLSGDAVAALALFETAELVTAPVPHVFDTTRGQRAFSVAQTGLTAMLAGQLGDALAYFEKALACPVPRTLTFLHRESHLRVALIHALYGAQDTALVHLAAAARVARSDSWAELGLDAETVLVEALLAPAVEAEESLERVEALPIAAELWPFHMLATHKLSVIAGHPARARDRAAHFERAGVVGPAATGVVGSALPWFRFYDAIASGDLSRAATELDRADRDLWQTAHYQAILEVLRGRPAVAVRILYDYAPHTSALPKAEAQRLTVLAVARHAESDAPAAEDVLVAVAPHLTAYSGRLMEFLSPGLAARAAEHVDRWPVVTEVPGSDARVGSFDFEPLRDREMDVLRAMATQQSRGEIAESLFLSVNTVKTHQRSLYRKLRVNSHAQALDVARRRGLI